MAGIQSLSLVTKIRTSVNPKFFPFSSVECDASHSGDEDRVNRRETNTRQTGHAVRINGWS